jgi:predicted transcriptional regulator
MYSNTTELAENKLLLLYLFSKINLPISNNQITEIILKNNLMDYFTLQQYITELSASKFLVTIDYEGKQRLKITESGSNVLNLFDNRISPSKKDLIDTFIKENIDTIKKQMTISADYTIEGDNYIVNLKATENDIMLMDLKVNVASIKQANELCTKWKNNSSDIYTNIISLLIQD